MTKNSWLYGALSAGLLTLSGCAAAPHPGKCPSPKTVTPKQVRASLAYMRAHLPNTPFVNAAASKSAPGLVKLVEGGTHAGVVYFDPRTHYLIIGLVINFGDKTMRIAGGESLLGTNHLPEPQKGARHD